jgi:hypothetical protein
MKALLFLICSKTRKKISYEGNAETQRTDWQRGLKRCSLLFEKKQM